VRTYGLFAANVFGEHDFIGGDADRGAYVLPANQTLRFRYRVLFHSGDEKVGKVAESFENYTKEK
jgi:hypothetical protein